MAQDYLGERENAVVRAKGDSGLDRTVYEFSMVGRRLPQLRLDEYHEQSRPTRRHAWVDTRVGVSKHNQHRYYGTDTILLTDVLVPTDVVREMLARIEAKGVDNALGVC